MSQITFQIPRPLSMRLMKDFVWTQCELLDIRNRELKDKFQDLLTYDVAFEFMDQSPGAAVPWRLAFTELVKSRRASNDSFHLSPDRIHR